MRAPRMRRRGGGVWSTRICLAILLISCMFMIHLTMESTRSATTAARPTLVIAYCTYAQEERLTEPVLGSEYMATVIAKQAFGDRDLQIRTCLALPEHLPKGVDPASKLGLELLGLYGVDIRFCAYGSTKLMQATLAKLPHVRVAPYAVDQNALRTSEEGRDVVHMPKDGRVNVYVNKLTGLPVGPLMTRCSRESWIENVMGIGLQFETKLKFSTGGLGIHMPYAFESFGRSRWNGGDSARVIQPHSEIYGRNDMFDVKESVTRSLKFDPHTTRLDKSKFMTMVNSNCGLSTIRTAIIRGLFGYAVFESLKKPVHNLGRCPLDPEGSIRAGLTLEERDTFRKKWPPSRNSPTPAQDLYKHYKFAIVFENNEVEGYATEKIIGAYNAATIPVYWGSGKAISTMFNMKAIIHCKLPRNLTSEISTLNYGEYKTKVCTSLELSTQEECTDLDVSNYFYEEIKPYFDPCIARVAELDSDDEAYERALAESLATVDPKSHELSGIWNTTRYAFAIRAAYEGLGYDKGRAQIQALVI